MIKVGLTLFLVSVAIAIAPLMLLADNDCKECHQDHFVRKFAHYPAADGLCSVCHDAKAHAASYGMDPVKTEKTADKACFICHENFPSNEKQHDALTMVDKECMSCHDPHGSDQKGFLRRPVAQICADCHDEVVNAKSPHSGFVKRGDCAKCHDPHTSRDGRPKLLRADSIAICLKCHGDRVQGSTRSLGNIKKKIEKANHTHKPATQDCLKCHVAHVSKFEGLLVKETNELCSSCHGARGGSVGGSHFGMDHPTSGPRDPFFEARPFNCASCHEPHGTTEESLFRYRYKGANRPYRDYACVVCHWDIVNGTNSNRPTPPWDEDDEHRF